MIGRKFMITSLFAVFVAACASDSQSGRTEPPEPTDYEQAVEQWHEKRVERLMREDGWLSLVGLYPLSEGINRFGSHDDNNLVFPDRAPQEAGVFVLADGEVKLAVEPGVSILHNGKTVMAMTLISDAHDSTTVLEMGTFRFHVIERAGKQYVRLKDTSAIARMRFRGIERYPVDERWRIEARFEEYDPPRTIRVPDVLGNDTVTACAGAVVFEIDGQECRLEPVSADEESMFIVFGDETSGVETYDGGRFVYVDAPDEDGRVVIDFNYAYNPPCVFTSYATCPLPHSANILPVAVSAGEKTFVDGL